MCRSTCSPSLLSDEVGHGSPGPHFTVGPVLPPRPLRRGYDALGDESFEGRRRSHSDQASDGLASLSHGDLVTPADRVQPPAQLGPQFSDSHLHGYTSSPMKSTLPD